MKKVFLALAVIATLSLTSCKKEVKQDESTEVVADSTSVDTTQVDTTEVK
jgi:predicted small lipoprotein YifL